MSAQLLHHLIAAAAAVAPERPAVLTENASATFAELDRQAAAVAGWVADRCAPGDRVAVIADNSLGYAQLYYGVPRSRRVLALINQRLSAAEQTGQLVTASPVVLAADRRHLAALGDVAELVPSIRHVVDLDSAQWRQVIAGPAAGPSPARPGDPAWLLFTSGSTGTPKGVLHTHRSVLAAVRGTIVGRAVTRGVYLLPFPMCHIAGYNMLVHHGAGSSVVLLAKFSPTAFADAVATHGVTSCSLAPTMLHGLLDHLDRTGTALPTLQSIAYGSAAIPADLLRRAIAVLRVDFHQGYGMTETAGNVTFLGPDEHRAGASAPSVLATAGRPHPGVEVAVVDDGGRPVPAGATGEIVVRGEQVTPGYWPDSTPATADGWLRTGDVGRLDDAGRLMVVDRRKDVIVTGGENVSSREVEDVLSTHPDVAAVAVVGVPDAYWGEAICAVVVPRAGSQPTADDLIAHVRARLAPFKRPRHVVLVDELPLTSNGKVAKPVLRQRVLLELTSGQPTGSNRTR
ncbi:AMP-binding protein [Mycobacterium sp. CPCC 205372]|uniref:AMP-binding protein n=1 Tax=Mycobacterium hippophais TaxID=3016340 RepID=A0ABT4PWR6_9MYCO|nr:AMP-binding protein [Mycobacterium hippophais]MCZ8380931.1 AMP-binding protein [Mycobacterium hippophais]